MIKTPSIQNKEIDDRGGDLRILRRRTICHDDGSRTAFWVPLQAHSIEGVNFSYFVLAGKIENRFSGVPLHRLNSTAFHMHISCERSRGQQILLACQEKLGFV